MPDHGGGPRHQHGAQSFIAGPGVRRREPKELGVAFEIERVLEPRRASDAELQQRIDALEAEIKALKRTVAKLIAKILPQDIDAA